VVTVFFVESQNQGGGGFSDLTIKIDSYDLVICAIKSLWQFLGLSLKIKQTSVYRLRHKTEGYDGVGHALRSSGLLRSISVRSLRSLF
jgi:hypothetical protein